MRRGRDREDIINLYENQEFLTRDDKYGEAFAVPCFSDQALSLFVLANTVTEALVTVTQSKKYSPGKSTYFYAKIS
jgi:hypothetical protein